MRLRSEEAALILKQAWIEINEWYTATRYLIKSFNIFKRDREGYREEEKEIERERDRGRERERPGERERERDI